jgi:hypothetical protein
MCKDTLPAIAKTPATRYTALTFLFHSATAVTSAQDPGMLARAKDAE